MLDIEKTDSEKDISCQQPKKRQYIEVEENYVQTSDWYSQAEYCRVPLPKQFVPQRQWKSRKFPEY